MNVSILQSQIALNKAAINLLHEYARECVVDLQYIRKHNYPEGPYVQKELDHTTKLIAKYAKLQRALKREIAEHVWEERAAQNFYKRIAAL